MELFKAFKYLALRIAIIIGTGIVMGYLFPVFTFKFLIFIIPFIFILFIICLKYSYLLYLLLSFLSFLYGNIHRYSFTYSFLFYKKLNIEGRIIEGKRKGGYHVVKINRINNTNVSLKAIFYYPHYVERGRNVSIIGELRPLNFMKNEGMVSLNKIYKRKGVKAKIHPKGSIKILESSQHNKLLNIFEYSRNYIFSVSERCVGKNSLYLRGMLLGEKGGFSEEEFTNLKKAGILHVFAVSGLHVGIIVSVLFIIARIAGLGNVLFSLILGGFLAFYAGLTKFQPSVLRASIMAYLLIMGIISERKTLPVVSLACAFILIVLFSPHSIFNPGFQLSFSATAGIIAFTEIFVYKKKKGVLKYVYPIFYSFLIALFAFLGALPVQAFHFQRVSLISPLSSLLVVPLVGLIIPASFIMYLSYPILPLIAKIAGNAVWLLIEVIKYIITFFSKFPMCSFEKMPIIFYLLPLGGLYIVYGVKKKRFVFLLTFLGMLNIFVFYHLLTPIENRFIFLNTRYGKVIFIKVKNKNILINCGSKADRTLKRFIDNQGIKKIDLLFLPTQKKGNNSGYEIIKEKVQSVIKFDTLRYAKITLHNVEIEIYGEEENFKLFIKGKHEKYAVIPELNSVNKDFKIIYTGKSIKELEKHPVFMTFYPLCENIYSIKREGGKWISL